MMVYDDVIAMLSSRVPPPDSDTLMLIEEARRLVQSHRLRDIIDVGTGNGLLPLVLATYGVTVTALDVHEPAIALLRVNSSINAVDGLIKAVVSDLFAEVSGMKADLIVSNPPQLPTAHSSHRVHWSALANNGGIDGRDVIDRIIRESPGHLCRPGYLMLLQLSCISVETTLKTMQEVGFAGRIVRSAKRTMGALSYERRILWDATEEEQHDVYLIEGVLV
jgi:HemK-related putative methylase